MPGSFMTPSLYSYFSSYLACSPQSSPLGKGEFSCHIGPGELVLTALCDISLILVLDSFSTKQIYHKLVVGRVRYWTSSYFGPMSPMKLQMVTRPYVLLGSLLVFVQSLMPSIPLPPVQSSPLPRQKSLLEFEQKPIHTVLSHSIYPLVLEFLTYLLPRLNCESFEVRV